jgi:hypothetical protein
LAVTVIGHLPSVVSKLRNGRKFDDDWPTASKTPHRSEVGARFTRFLVEESALVGNLTSGNRMS